MRTFHVVTGARTDNPVTAIAEELELRRPDQTLLAKAYLSPDGRKLRIVVPSLTSFAQTKIDADHHLIDVTLDLAQARAELNDQFRKRFQGGTR